MISTPLSILVADDQPSIYDFVQMCLIDHQGIFMAYAQRIEEMHKAIRSHDFDLILLDIHFPEGNALHEIPLIRRECPTIGVVPLTVESDPDFIAIQSSIGVDGWIPKGSNARGHLLATIDRYLCNRVQCANHIYCLASHIPQIAISFHSSTSPISPSQRTCLYSSVSSLPYSPDRHALSIFAEQLNISPTSIVKFMKRRRLPSFSKLHRVMSASLAISMQWLNSTFSIEHITESVSRYSAEALNRTVRQLFHITLPAVRNLRNIESIKAHHPITVSFIHQTCSRNTGADNSQVLINIEIDSNASP